MATRKKSVYTLGGLLLLSLMLLFLVPSQGHAATFTVNSTADATSAALIANCQAGGVAQCTLRAAIQAANVPAAGATTITLPAGTYVLTLGAAGEDLAATGDLDITSLSPVTINGAGAATTIIDGNNNDRIFDILGATSTVSITGVTLRNGNSFAAVGGAIRTGGAGRTLNLDSVVITGNKTNANIGGTAMDIGGGATVTMNNVAVTNNIPVPPAGGNIIGLGAGSTFTVTNSTISRNGDNGISNRGTVTLTNVTISTNTAPNNAGIDNKAGGTVTLQNCTVTDNIAIAAGGIGGIANAGTVTVKNTIIANNTTNNCGGVIISGGNNLSNVAGCGLTAVGDIINPAPLLGPLANNIGPVQTHALLTGSPAIDAGAAAGCPAADARGITRPVAGNIPPGVATCDIGAFEFRPQLITVTLAPPFDFGSVSNGTTADHVVTLSNAGDGALAIGTIAVANPLAAPFSLAVDNCSGRTLTLIPVPAVPCTITARFAPTIAGPAGPATFSIPSNDPVTPVVSFAISGTGVATAVPGILVTDSIAPKNDNLVPFGGVIVGGSADATITITNTGTADLVLGAIASVDPLAAPFSKLNDTCSGKTIAPSSTCSLTVRFAPAASAAASDTFDIPSTGLPTVVMTVNGTGGTVAVGTGVNNPPSNPVLVTPENGQTGVPTTMTFVWNKAVDPDGNAVTYHFDNCTDAGFTTGCTNADVAAAAPSGLFFAGLGSFGAGIILIGFVAGSGLKRSKKTMLVITLLLLAGGLFMSCTRTKTETVPGTLEGTTADQVSNTVKNLTANTTYYWKVVADDGNGGLSSSDVRTYTTAP